MAGGEGVMGKVLAKLVDTKMKWAREGRLLTGDAPAASKPRLPPGQREVKNWPVLDLGIRPEVTKANWKLEVDGLVEAPLAWTFDAFMAQPQTSFTNDIHCVTQWSRYDNDWQGVAVATLLEMARPKDEARFVAMTSYDGYTTNLAIEDFSRAENLFAHSWAGAPLERQHGGPVRLVVPHLYFWKSPKWITRIEFLRDDRPGFWEVRGYHNRGNPWAEERYG